MGATLEDYTPTQDELARVKEVSNDLLKSGVYLIGFDLIGGYISEINITSPRLLLANAADLSPYRRFANLVLNNH